MMGRIAVLALAVMVSDASQKRSSLQRFCEASLFLEHRLEAGFGETDITPTLGNKPVYIAGFGQNRKATKAHDPLFARAVVLKEGKTKLALVSVDLVGFFRPNVVNVRKQLAGFDYVLVSSTHTH